MVSDAEKPGIRRRWGRWVALALFALIALAILGHAFWGGYEASELDREVAALRAAGEPMVAGDFRFEHCSDAENAVPLLRQAADAIDDRSEAWVRLEQMEIHDLLAEENGESVRAMVQRNAAALRLLETARDRKAVGWQIPLGKPMLSTLLPDLGKQKKLAHLVRLAALSAHAQGDDREAMERIADLLMLSRAMEKMGLGAMPSLLSYFISSTAAGAAMQIEPDLRIGSGKGEVAEDKVRLIIGNFLDEEGSKQRALAAMKFERALGLEWITTIEALSGGARPSNELQKAGLMLRIYILRPAVFGDARFLLRYAKANQDAVEASGNWPAFKRGAQTPQAMKQKLDTSPNWHAMARTMAADYGKFMLQQHRASTLRRLAATSLAVRLYQAEHAGSLPHALGELKPKYLHEVPLDPMSEDQTLRYSAERALLWSVGENGSDEAGSDRVVNESEARWGRDDVLARLKRDAK